MLNLSIHPSQYPEVAARRIARQLSEGRLPGRFLYDSPAQSARWLRYHRSYAPPQIDDRFRILYRTAFEAISGSFDCHLSLGCGGGDKDAWLHEVTRSKGNQLKTTVLTDTSPSLIVTSMLQLPEARGLSIDLSCEPDRADFELQGRTLWTAFGMVPNLDAASFLRWMNDKMTTEDQALVSANLHPKPMEEAAEAIVPQYDNPLAKAWYEGALRELGLSSTVSVGCRSLQKDGEVWQIEVHSETSSDALLFDRTLSLPDSLQVFFSRRYTPAAFETLLAECGFSIEARFLEKEEGLWLVRRRPPSP